MVLSTFNRPSFRMADGRGTRGARGAVAKDRIQRGASHRRGRGRRVAAAGGVARCGGGREGREGGKGGKGGEGGWKMNQDGRFW